MTLRSMTGFGRATYVQNGFSFEVMIKGVNSRFSEFNFKMPPPVGPLEQNIRTMLQRDIRRGKVTLTVNGNFEILNRTKLYCDKNAVQNYMAICRSLGLPTAGRAGLAAKWEALRIPGVLKVGGMEEISAGAHKLLVKMLRRSISSFLQFKTREGRKIEKELLRYNGRLRGLAQKMKARSESIKQEGDKQVRLLADRYCRDSEALRDRIGFEVAAALDRLDISEECARLIFHISEFQSAVAAPAKSSPGRKLDFLLQEMHREINTIGAKGRDSGLSSLVVEAKDYVERMREQVQNVE